MTAIYKLNREFNGIEIYFEAIPKQSIIDVLKASKFRWHYRKKCWYAKQNDNSVSLAKSIVDGDTQLDESPVEEIKTGGTVGDGFMGGGKWTGINCGTLKGYGEINKAIKKEMKRLYPDVQFNTRGKSYSGGQSSHFFISLPIDKLFKDREECIKIYKRNYMRYTWLSLSEGSNVRSSDATQEQVQDAAEHNYNTVTSRYMFDANRYSDSNENGYISDYAYEVLKKAIALYSSFIHDETNSMVDYFSRNLYDNYGFINTNNFSKSGGAL
ncbi:MAG: hypothetical protein FWC20_00570 [Oscillospiraceae bacterium]|nr:hypothetical protein [Oscillospiraceae bacterium]MCL2277886.1 hypothetical protein [Oscillospiraceae bacterium]